MGGPLFSLCGFLLPLAFSSLTQGPGRLFLLLASHTTRGSGPPLLILTLLVPEWERGKEANRPQSL